MDNLTVTYRGIAVPENFHEHLSSQLFTCWREGVDAALGEPVAEAAPKLRAFRDRHGDIWHEIEPNEFTCADTRQQAAQKYSSAGGVTLAVAAGFGPLTEVTE